MGRDEKLFSRYQSAKEAVEVDLIPVMNLFVTLIPFLLMAAAFYHVSVIPTSLPSQTDESSDVASDNVTVTVNLQVERSRIKMTAQSSGLDEETLAALSLEIKKGKDGRFELVKLQQALFHIKQRFNKSDTVVVLPAEDVRYLDVVEILDTAREMKITQGDKEQSVPLFPVVVMSKKV